MIGFARGAIEPLWSDFFTRISGIPDPQPGDDSWRNHPVMHEACEFTDLVTLRREMEVLAELPYLGDAIAANPPTSIHHLYHLTMWCRHYKMADPPADIRRVIEWGGGYGSLARLALDFVFSDVERYTIIDHPAMHRFSRAWLGERKNVERIDLDHARTVKGPCDLFIATWSLSESASRAQNFVINQDFFGARHLLIAYNATAHFHGSSHFAERMREIPDATIMSTADGSSTYLFR